MREALKLKYARARRRLGVECAEPVIVPGRYLGLEYHHEPEEVVDTIVQA